MLSKFNLSFPSRANEPIKSKRNPKKFSSYLTRKLDFLTLENEVYIGDNVNTKTTYLIKKDGRDDLQEVCKEGPRKAFSANLKR